MGNSTFDSSMHNAFCTRMDEILHRYAKKNAFTYMRNSGINESYTFHDIAEFLDLAKREVEKRGLMPGERVAIVSPHSPFAVYTGIALAYYGLTIVLVDASLPHEEIASLVTYSDVKAVFTTTTIYEQLIHRIDGNMAYFSLDNGLQISAIDENIIATEPSKDVDKDIIAILYSSGTTGQMKGVMVTYESVLKSREVFVRLSGLEDFMTYMLVLPFNHIAGFTGAMTFFLTGCEIGFIEDMNATKLQTGLLNFQPYYFAMVPKVFEVMEQKIRAAIREKGKGVELMMNILFRISRFFRKRLGINIGKKMFHNLTAQVFGENIFGIGTGASPCKRETAEFFLNLGLEWANLYATTETSVPIVATGVLDQYPADTVGNVNHHPEIEVKIGKKDQNGIGEIMVKSQLMMKGYFKRPDLTEMAFEDGFFKTGDYGYTDKKGNLHITGRMKESIVLQNGKKVSPVDVDEYYTSRVPECDIASRGIPERNEEYDEICMFIATKGITIDEREAIRNALEQASRLAPDMYKLSGIYYISEIPRTSVGKIKRFCLVKESSQESTGKAEKGTLKEDELLNIVQKYCTGSSVSMEDCLREDLGIDSLAMFEIACEIEEKFKVDISGALDSVSTINDLMLVVKTSETSHDVSYPAPRNENSIRRLRRWLKWIRLFYKVEVNGIENIPKKSNYLICANHACNLDPLWILTAMEGRTDFKRICCMAAKHTMEGRIAGSLFESFGGIPVDREGNTIPAMNNAKRCLKDGNSLIIFPEGKRSRDGSMLPFKDGAAKLAIDTNKSILPVRIEGGFEVFPRWKKLPHLFDWRHFRRYRITVSFGTPIFSENIETDELTKTVRNSIEALEVSGGEITSNTPMIEDKVVDIQSVIRMIRTIMGDGFTDPIYPDMEIKDEIGMDSLQFFELCVELSKKYGVNVEDNLHDHITVGELLSILSETVKRDGIDERSRNKVGKLPSVRIKDYPAKKRFWHHIFFCFFTGLSRIMWKFEIFGTENIPQNRNYIVCPNHESHLDGLWVWTAMGKRRPDYAHICCMAKKEHLESLMSRIWLKVLGGIPVDRTGNSAVSIARCRECIETGYCLLIHPEGTRTKSGKMGEFKQGAVKLAVETERELLPVCIQGAYDIYPYYQKMPKVWNRKKTCRYTLRISFGRPILPENKSVSELTNELKDSIERMK